MIGNIARFYGRLPSEVYSRYEKDPWSMGYDIAVTAEVFGGEEGEGQAIGRQQEQYLKQQSVSDYAKAKRRRLRST